MPVHRNTIKTKIVQKLWKYQQQSFPNGSLCFLLKFYCSSCLMSSVVPTSSPYMFWAIQQELFFMSVLKRFAKLQRKRPWRSFFGGLQHLNMLQELLRSYFDEFSRIAIMMEVWQRRRYNSFFFLRFLFIWINFSLNILMIS